MRQGAVGVLLLRVGKDLEAEFAILAQAARLFPQVAPVVCGDKVLVGSDDGRLYLVRLSDGKELWSYEIGQAIDSSPAVADGKIVIGSNDGSVYCFGAK